MGLRPVRPNNQWVWSLRQEGIKGLRLVSFGIITSFERTEPLSLPLPLPERIQRKVVPSISLRRSIPLHQKRQNGFRRCSRALEAHCRRRSGRYFGVIPDTVQAPLGAPFRHSLMQRSSAICSAAGGIARSAATPVALHQFGGRGSTVSRLSLQASLWRHCSAV
nr:hypothetical protein VITISV_032034 [Vitis vinifera]